MSCDTKTCTSSTFIVPASGSTFRAVSTWYEPHAAWIAAVQRMHERWRHRRRLLELDDRMLADIGLSRADAIREARKPFWR